MPETMSARKLRFDAFELDLSTQELFRHGERVKLAPQPFKVLATLASRAGSIVSREELQKSVWEHGVYVDFEGSLHSCVKQIRAALGDDRVSPRFIETLPRQGYRFLPPLTASRRSPRSVMLALTAVVLLLGALSATRSRESLGPTPVAFASEAEELTFKGRYLLKSGSGEDALDRAASYFEESIRHDPEFAPAHVGLAELQLRRAMATGNAGTYASAERSARRALALAPSAEAEFVLALSRWYGAWDWEEAGSAFRRAIVESPDLARPRHWYAYYLTGLGRHEEAIVEIERAHALDPLSPEIQSDVGWFYYFAGRYNEAIEASLRTLELEPSFLLAQDCLIESRLAKGDQAAALVEARRFLERAEISPEVRSLPEFWRLRLERGVENPYAAAVAAIRLGQNDEALLWLRKAADARSLWMPVLAVDPRLESMPPSRELTDLLQSVGLGKKTR
jgi:DNA-binding winged helix-turn-helix (wHTH) protein/Tfp pilus assembly protein PilF